MAEVVFVGLGSNIGDKSASLKCAILQMNTATSRVQAVSDFYVTDPVTPTDQAAYLNAVAKIETEVSLQSFFELTLDIEQKMGRESKGDFQERCIDIDILLFGNEVYHSKNLVVPHPKFHQRSFVLIPFKQISPETMHPVLGVSIGQLYHRMIWGVYS